jgi:hypothetical protein
VIRTGVFISAQRSVGSLYALITSPIVILHFLGLAIPCRARLRAFVGDCDLQVVGRLCVQFSRSAIFTFAAHDQTYLAANSIIRPLFPATIGMRLTAIRFAAYQAIPFLAAAILNLGPFGPRMEKPAVKPARPYGFRHALQYTLDRDRVSPTLKTFELNEVF